MPTAPHSRSELDLARSTDAGVAFSRSCDSPNSWLADAEVFPLDRASQSGQEPRRGSAGQAVLRQSPEVYAPVLSHYPRPRFPRLSCKQHTALVRIGVRLRACGCQL